MKGHKRTAALVAALITVVARRFGLAEADLALLLDVVEIVLGVGLGSHVIGLQVTRRAARKAAAAVTVALLVAGCAVTNLDACVLQVSKADAARDRLVCQGHNPIKVPRLDPALRACVLEAAP